VLKYIYNFMAPRPWDVVVFKNPQNNQENYIKRLVGLPGEMIEIINGDIFFRVGKDFNNDGVIDRQDFEGPCAARAAAECPWQIRRKDRRKVQESMWQTVFDNDYRPNEAMIDEYGLGVSSQPALPPLPGWEPTGPAAARWKTDIDRGRQFDFTGGERPCELTFKAERSVFAPQYAYNRAGSGDDGGDMFVCSDLNLSFAFVPNDASSRVSLVLTNLHHQFRAEVCADGTCTLYHRHPDKNGGKEYRLLPSRNIGPLKVGRGYELALWHADYQLTLWVEDEIVLQTTDAEYSPDADELRRNILGLRKSAGADDGDPAADEAASADGARTQTRSRHRASPEQILPTPQVRIVAQGGPSELSHVRLMRDVYYTYLRLREPPKGDKDVLMEYAGELGVRPGNPGWGVTGNPIVLRKNMSDPDLDEFFVLGDNSPQSLDGRAWTAAASTLRLWRKNGVILSEREDDAEPIYTLGTVPRYSMIGRALFVYWPSGFRVPGLEGLPFIPNVGRMRLIR